MARMIANRYELLERLGGGGMGQVFNARDTRLEREVAIKTVDSAESDDTTLERFRREAVATAGLSDPHVVSIYDAGFDDGDAYIVMEKLTGPSLAERIKAEQHLSIPETLDVALAVASGLTAAHKVGVVHRDIKPGNVMFHDGSVKIVDFGIAQLGQQHGAALTAPATAMGTAAYMSPEQAMGKQATDKSDWYALGCLLMASLTGTPPFRGEAIAVAQQQINAEPPRASQLRTGVPPALDDLIDRLLAKDPDDRPTSAAIIDQIKALRVDPDAPTMLMTATQPQATRVMPAAAPAPRYDEYEEIEEYDDDFDDLDEYDDHGRLAPRRRSGAGWVVGMVIVLALLLAGLWFFVLRDPSTTPTPEATPSVGETSQEPAPEETTEEPTQEPTEEPTQESSKKPFPKLPPLPGQGDGDQDGDGDQNGDGQGDGQDDGNGDGQGEGNGSDASQDDDKKRDKINEAISEVDSDSARSELEDAFADASMDTAGLAQFRLQVEKMRFSGEITSDEADEIIKQL